MRVIFRSVKRNSFERRKIMVKEIQLEGKGWARGRNGYFIPRRVDCFKDVKGQINLSVSSAHPGKVEPISLRLTKAEALELVSVIHSLAGKREETPRVVVVIEGGNVQEILADRPGVNVVKVDYDVEGTPREELKRVAQYLDDVNRTYELAIVRHWGEALSNPKDTKRFFRNARD
jgi:hypothetical protein